MVPLPFVIALFAAAFAVSEVLARGTQRRNGWLLAFLATLIFQEILIGLRFGYGFEGLARIQPLSAACIAPLAYLSFKRPALDGRLALHLLLLFGVCLALAVWLDGLDTVLALGNLIYAALLIRLGLGGSDALGWVEVRRAGSVLVMLSLVAAFLVISSLTDGAIAYDFWVSEGSNTARIAGWTTAVGLGVVCSVLLLAAIHAKSGAGARLPEAASDRAVFDALETLMAREELHLDPDINLNRIARRLVLPARDVSRAVNTIAGCNVSQHINRLRVRHACGLLKDTGGSITQILYESGFNTKSNFNREFTRITGQSPSGWRAENVGSSAG